MNTLQEIKHLCISSNAFLLNDNIIKSDEKKQEAQHLTFIEGYNAFSSENDSIPETIKHFTFLHKYWNNGLQEGFNTFEVLNCTSCQDKSIEMCYIHD